MKDDAFDAVIGELLSITPLVRRTVQRKLVRTAFATIEHNITLPHLEIMLLLRKCGTQHIAGIGEALQIPKPQMTHLIDRLEGLGIVTRQPDPADRRTINIDLTARGRDIIDEMDRVIKTSLKEKMAGLTVEELGELSVSLKKLRDILTKL